MPLLEVAFDEIGTKNSWRNCCISYEEGISFPRPAYAVREGMVYAKTERDHRLRRVMILLLILALGVFFLMRSRFNPIARDLAITQVTNQTSDLINDAIAEQIARDNIQYDRDYLL